MHSTWHHSDELLYSKIFPAGAGLKALTDPINCLWRNPPCNSDEITTSLMPLEARPFIMGWLMEQKAFLLCTGRQNPHPWRPPFLPCPPHIILYWILNYWFLGKKNTSGFKLQWKPAQRSPWRWCSALVHWGSSAEHDKEPCSRGGPKALQPQQWGCCTPTQPGVLEQKAVAGLFLQPGKRGNKNPSRDRRWVYTACMALHSLPVVSSQHSA